MTAPSRRWASVGPEATGHPALLERVFPDMDRMSASVLAVNRRTGGVIASHAPTVPMLPASNVKLVTAARAFAELGPGYRFETTVHALGHVRDGHLVGDLVLTGRGAPDLSQADLMDLAATVADAGIESVDGEVVVDASHFDGQALGPGWTWDDGQFPYGAKSTPLALERNTVVITVAHRNDTIQVDASPTSDIVRLTVDVTADPDGESDLAVYKERASEVIRVEGRVPPGSTTDQSSPVDDPMMHAASVFRDCLEAKGVAVNGWTRIEREPVDTPAEPIGTARSAPVSSLVRDMLVHSDNFVAEQLARSIAAKRTGLGTWGAWGEHANAFLEERGTAAARVFDGSGMSRYNLLSARTVVDVLEWSHAQPWGETAYRSLPRAGIEGTVADRLEGVSVPVRAKTGTLTGVRTLSGFVSETDDDPDIVFSCLLTNLTDMTEPETTDRIDDLVAAIIQTAGLGE